MADNKKQETQKQDDVQHVDAQVIDKREGKLHRLGQKIKGGVRKVVDSTPFRVATGIISAAALGAAGVILMGKIDSSDIAGDLEAGSEVIPALDVDVTSVDTSVDTAIPF